MVFKKPHRGVTRLSDRGAPRTDAMGSAHRSGPPARESRNRDSSRTYHFSPAPTSAMIEDSSDTDAN
jgi:hypothetical protein